MSHDTHPYRWWPTGATKPLTQPFNVDSHECTLKSLELAKKLPVALCFLRGDDVAERVAYDGEGGFRMSCRSVNPGGKGFDVRPKKHAAQRLSAAAAAAVGGGFAVGPE